MESPRRILRFPTLWTATREKIAARRAAESARRQLSLELADYATAADRNDLNALLDSYPDTEVAELRDLLNRSLTA